MISLFSLFPCPMNIQYSLINGNSKRRFKPLDWLNGVEPSIKWNIKDYKPNRTDINCFSIFPLFLPVKLRDSFIVNITKKVGR